MERTLRLLFRYSLRPPRGLSRRTSLSRIPHNARKLILALRLQRPSKQIVTNRESSGAGPGIRATMRNVGFLAHRESAADAPP